MDTYRGNETHVQAGNEELDLLTRIGRRLSTLISDQELSDVRLALAYHLRQTAGSGTTTVQSLDLSKEDNNE